MRATGHGSLAGDRMDISIHALREEGDPPISRVTCSWVLFLSTPSARRATAGAAVDGDLQDISIHALREEGDTVLHRGYGGLGISIHALREEGDVLSP